MEVNFSQPKSKAFTIFLRFLQMTTSIILSLLVTKLSSSDNITCQHGSYNLVLVSSIILFVAAGIGLLVNHCKNQFNKTVFFVFASICLILSTICLIGAFTGYSSDNVCASNKIQYKFAIIDIFFTVAINLAILFLSFFWIQRFANSPGNLTWPILFFYSWPAQLMSLMVVIGIISLVVFLLTLISNLIAYGTGVTVKVKKIVVICWVLSLLLMIVNQILAIVTLLAKSQVKSFEDLSAKMLLQMFIAINALQFLFWILGMMTLRFQNGDKVRDALLSFGKEEGQIQQNFNDQEQDNRRFGTLK